jgi:urocanate hydratase
MAALVAQVQRGVIGVLRQSSVATLYSLALRLKEVGVLDGHSSSSSSRTTELEAVADVVSERDMSADILDGLIPSSSSQDRRNQAQRRTLKKGEHGLHQQLIPAASWRVLNRLQDEGYESYLVGGSVRDLLLKQTPKDFDVLTTADPKQVENDFLKEFGAQHCYS